MSDIKDCVIQKYPGGFLVQLQGEIQIVTSLSKAIKLVRDFLSEGKDEEQ
jgi:hypothetical protein